MRTSLVMLFACVAFFASCIIIMPQDAPYLINKELLLSYSNFDDSFKKPHNPLTFGEDHIAKNCKTYFEMSSNHDIDETINNQMVKSEYLICDALKILSESSGVKTKNINASNSGEELLTKLDLRTFASSFFRLCDKNSYTLKSLFPEHASSLASVALVETEDWAFTLEIVAVANINENSTPDWVVWVLDESKSGNYCGYSTLIIFDPNNQAIYKATPYP